MIIGIVIQINNVKYAKTALTTEATITKIDSYFSGTDDNEKDYNVYITYKVRDKEYNGELREYYSGMREGQKVTIYYNPEDPSDYKSKSINYTGYFLMAFAIIFMGISTIIQKVA